MLFVLVLLSHHRRRIVHLAITEHPTAMWTAQQIIEAFPDDSAPRWLLRDRDAIYGDLFRRRVAGMGISEVISSPSSPWQNPYAERLIGSIRRECLDHVIVFNQTHLRRTLARYVFYYHGSRTHLSLAKDAPTPRRVQAPDEGRVIAFPEVGGLHTTVTNDAQPDVTQVAFTRCPSSARRHASERTQTAQPRAPWDRDHQATSSRDSRDGHQTAAQ